VADTLAPWPPGGDDVVVDDVDCNQSRAVGARTRRPVAVGNNSADAALVVVVVEAVVAVVAGDRDASRNAWDGVADDGRRGEACCASPGGVP
jgi:hypothetical protein